MSHAQPQLVKSYLQDNWLVPENPSQVEKIKDPSTGEVIALASAEGLDLEGAVNYARSRGRATLQDLTIHERALKIKQLAMYLDSHKQSLYKLAAHTGATKRDNFPDIDGGIITMFTISSKARRELPNSTVVIDGPPEVLSGDGSFLGGHIYTSIPGIAVQINAFNFPVWGVLEKFAPAFIAGVPTIIKPATQTSFVTAELVRLMVQSGLLPPGSLQLISGSARTLLDHLDYRDHVAFTGSAATAALLKSQDNVIKGGIQFSAEADSLNAAILGEDVTKDSPEFDLYVKAIFTEMTVKAGQKCTAIRRAIVPQDLKNDVIKALQERLSSRVVMGNPASPETTMGPLVSTSQQTDVAQAVKKLEEAGGVVVYSGQEDPVRQQFPQGAFFAPTILDFVNPFTPAVHAVEAFGPVVSILGYRSAEEAIRIAAAGGGSLVASIITHSPETAAALGRGIAAHHGRVHYLDRVDAKTSTGHGSPLPHLVHGGPGRAGGGEELGGVRGIKHFMQRTAIQGSPDHLTALTGEWFRGAAVNRVTRMDVEKGTGVHPFRKDLTELQIGDQFASELRKVTLDEITAFAQETGDTFYAHTDEQAATANPFFPRRVAHGYLLVSWAAGLFVEPAPGPVLANYGLENLRFLTPVTYDDSIRVELTAKRITPRVTEDYGEVTWDTVLYNQKDEIVATYDVLTLVEKVNTTYA